MAPTSVSWYASRPCPCAQRALPSLTAAYFDGERLAAVPHRRIPEMEGVSLPCGNLSLSVYLKFVILGLRNRESNVAILVVNKSREKMNASKQANKQ